MQDLSILVIEDEHEWRSELKKIIHECIDPQLHVDTALSYSHAIQQINNNHYDLAIVDLHLFDQPSAPVASDQQGLALLAELRQSPRNRLCSIIVLTANGTIPRTRLAFRDFSVSEFVEKNEFDDEEFCKTARAALLAAQLRQAAHKNNERYRLNIKFSQNRLISSELLRGANVRGVVMASQTQDFNAAELAKRADDLNWMVLAEKREDWRAAAKQIGQELYTALQNDRNLWEGLISARAQTQTSSELWIQFSGDPAGLSIPFELMRDEHDYLSFAHPIIRRIDQYQFGQQPKSEPFNSFIADLVQRKQQLRLLIVGANSDGFIPQAEDEARLLATDIEQALKRWGLDHKVDLLIGDDVTYGNVSKALTSGRYHIFHYAGHGRYNDRLPEVSDLVLQPTGQQSTLTARSINLLVRNTDLQFVFLSGCLGARVADLPGRGDFHGMFDSLARANVPAVLGYRWMVPDDTAKQFAQTFYQTLWHTFSPGEALLQARIKAATTEYGMDDETWASPVLLMHNP